MSAKGGQRMIMLESSDKEIFEISMKVAAESEFIKHMIEDDRADAAIPFPNIRGKILAKVIEYCKKHAEYDNKVLSESELAEIKSFDTEFVKVDQEDILELTLAAYQLIVMNLVELMCQATANVIKDKSVEEVQRFFHLEKNFSLEEEAEIRAENAWVFQ